MEPHPRGQGGSSSKRPTIPSTGPVPCAAISSTRWEDSDQLQGRIPTRSCPARTLTVDVRDGALKVDSKTILTGEIVSSYFPI